MAAISSVGHSNRQYHGTAGNGVKAAIKQNQDQITARKLGGQSIDAFSKSIADTMSSALTFSDSIASTVKLPGSLADSIAQTIESSPIYFKQGYQIHSGMLQGGHKIDLYL